MEESERRSQKGGYTQLERHTQNEFPKTMNQCFPELFFHDTHTTDYITPPQKPDITVTSIKTHPSAQTVLAFIELKSRRCNIDGSAKGEVISAVNRLHNRLIVKRDIYGFALNVNEERNVFIYLKKKDGLFPHPSLI